MRRCVPGAGWQGLKPDPSAAAVAARLKPCPCYKAKPRWAFAQTITKRNREAAFSAEIRKLNRDGLCAACKGRVAMPSLVLLLRENCVPGAGWQGLKPDPFVAAVAARLKPCPCYKAKPRWILRSKSQIETVLGF